MKLYWATDPDSESWGGPFESDADAIADARSQGMGIEGDVLAIWIAPIDAELDDDDAFWDQVARLLLWDLDGTVDALVEGGWVDPEDGWDVGFRQDRDRILAYALRQVLGPRPDWRCIDTAKARKVDL